MKDGRVGILLSDSIHLPFSRASNSSNSSGFKARNSYKKSYFTLKERSHKNSFVLARKLAPKEEQWNSLQRAVNFQTSWNFVIKKDLHCNTLNSVLYEKEWIWNYLCTPYFHFAKLSPSSSQIQLQLGLSLALFPNYPTTRPPRPPNPTTRPQE